MKNLLIKAKKILIVFLFAFTLVSYSSCETTQVTVSDNVYDDYYQYEIRPTVTFDILIRYGVPYYYNGNILYYLYDGIYYYPYWYNDYWYVKAFIRPINPLRHNYHFRPSYRDYRFAPGVYRGYGVPPRRPHNGHMNRPPQRYPNHNDVNRPPQHRPNNGHMNRPPQARPNRMPRNSQNNGHFGGKR